MKVLGTLLLGMLLLVALDAQAGVRRGFIKSANCVLRSQPNDKAPPIADVPLDADVEVLETVETEGVVRGLWWFRVQYQEQTGWVRGVYLFIENDREPMSDLSEETTQDAGQRLERVFVLDQKQGVAPELRLHEDGTFGLTINMCVGMMPVTGKYTSTETTIVLYGFKAKYPPASRIHRVIVQWLRIELEWTAQRDLRIINDISYDAGTDTYGFCAPRKGQVFQLRE